MKKIVGLLLISLFLINPFRVLASNHHAEIIQRLDSDIEAGNKLLSEIETYQNDPDTVLSILARDIPTVTKHWEESAIYYESKALDETDEELRTILLSINADIKGLSSSLHSVEGAIEAGDPDAFTNSFKQYDIHIDSLNSHIEQINTHFGGADYAWLLWPFLLALVISTVLFMMSRGNPVLPAEQLRNQFEFALFKSSLWPLGGSAISYFWYLFTPPGGTFYILWGPIAVGYFQFLRSLYTYITEARPAINLAKKEEKSKLETLIRSDKFQKESMEEKVREIEKRSGVIDLNGEEGIRGSKEEKADGDVKYCQKCNSKNTSRANYCRHCGAKL